MTKYIVAEMQTTHEGQVANLITSYDDRFHAESAYYMIMAAAALSTLAVHTAMVYTNDGTLLLKGSYTHETAPAPEPTPSLS